MNGLYLQLHAYMLRVAIPYGTLNGRQMRQLARIAETYDKGYGHFTTRQNIQFNWPKLTDVGAILVVLIIVFGESVAVMSIDVGQRPVKVKVFGRAGLRELNTVTLGFISKSVFNSHKNCHFPV